MASYNELLALIDAYINRNGVQAITGQILNGVLKAMVDQLGRGYTLMGYAEPTGDPGTPDGPESWFASVPGTYTNYGEIQVAAGELALLSFAPSEGWTKNTIYEGFREVTATADDNIGFPQVGVTYANGVLSFDFKNIKGEPGENGQDGDPAGFGAVTASVDDQVGTPSVSVSSSGPDTAKVFSFAFHNLKGETGVTSVVATVDNTSGNPQCSVSLQGGQLTLAFTGLKGAQGDTGSSVDYPFTIVNNLTTNDATQALSAAMGVQLESEVSQLEAKVIELEDVCDEFGTLYHDFNPTVLDNKVVSSDTGAISNFNGQKAVAIVLTGLPYTKIKFKTTNYGGNYGYGFFVGGVWSGVRTTSTGEVTVDIPEGATEFRACWNATNVPDNYFIGTAENNGIVGANDIYVNKTDISVLKPDVEDLKGDMIVESVLDADVEEGAVSSDDGSYVSNTSCARVTIDLTGASFKKLGFKTSQFQSNFGYGFFLDDSSWTGVKTIAAETVLIDVPANAVSFRLCWNKNNITTNPITAKYDSNLNYEHKLFRDKDIEIGQEMEALATEVHQYDESFLVQTTLDVEVEGGAVSSDDGSYVANTSCSRVTVDLTGVKFKKLGFKTSAFSSNLGYGFFLSDNSWTGVKTVNATLLIDVPDNAVEFRLCWNKNNIASNPITAEYVSNFDYEHNKAYEADSKLRERLDAIEPNVAYMSTTLDKTIRPFVLPVPAGDGQNGNVDVANLTVATMYQMWDDLIAEYPDFLVNTNLGLDESGTYQLRKITFHYKNYLMTPDTRRVVVVANLHGPGPGGDTHMQSYIVYYFVKWVLDNLETSELAQWFAVNYNFVIVPIGNPWGYDNASRYNSRGVDLNRNFNAGWTSGDHRGESAASEKETQYVQQVITDNMAISSIYSPPQHPAYLFIDFHSHMDDNSYLQYLPNSANIVNDISSICQRYWRILSKNQTLGITVESEGGMAKKYAEDVRGIPSLVIEGAPYDGTTNYSADAMTNTMRLFVALLRIGLF